MIRADLSATSILNAVTPRLRQTPVAAVGVLLLTALPFRLSILEFIVVLRRLGQDAPYYGNLLTILSAMMTASFFLSLYGRAVFIHAMHSRPSSWRDLLRIDGKTFLAYVYVALMIETFLILTFWTAIAIPLAILLAGVAAAVTTDPPAIGVAAPLRSLSPYLRHGGALASLMFVFAAGFAVAVVNYTLLARLITWLAGAVPGVDAVRWHAAAASSNRLALAIVTVAATTVEPFFLTAIYVYAGRVRARGSGDDIMRRFREITAAKRLRTVAVAALLLLALPLRASAPTITTADYVSRLSELRGAFTTSRFAEAQRIVDVFSDVAFVTDGAIRYEPDRVLLRAIADAARQSKYDVVLGERLAATIDALQAGAAFASRPPDPNLLSRIRAREKVGELMRGGELKTLPPADPTLVDEVERIYTRSRDWVAAKLEKIFDWFEKIWPNPRPDTNDERFLGVPFVVWVVTTLIVATVLLLGLYVLRRSKRRVVSLLSAEVAASNRDADPLSRDANEWEMYARELAQSGRLREAIRAWYHAVLVTLYRSGILHYRKGVTNWEYVSTLAPAHDWRPHFVEMTRNFDREWYGRRDTAAEALDECAADARLILDAVRQAGR